MHLIAVKIRCGNGIKKGAEMMRRMWMRTQRHRTARRCGCQPVHCSASCSKSRAGTGTSWNRKMQHFENHLRLRRLRPPLTLRRTIILRHCRQTRVASSTMCARCPRGTNGKCPNEKSRNEKSRRMSPRALSSVRAPGPRQTLRRPPRGSAAAPSMASCRRHSLRQQRTLS